MKFNWTLLVNVLPIVYTIFLVIALIQFAFLVQTVENLLETYNPPQTDQFFRTYSIGLNETVTVFDYGFTFEVKFLSVTTTSSKFELIVVTSRSSESSILIFPSSSAFFEKTVTEKGKVAYYLKVPLVFSGDGGKIAIRNLDNDGLFTVYIVYRH